MRTFEIITENTVSGIDSKTFAKDIKELVARQKKIPANHPFKNFIQELLSFVAQGVKQTQNLKTESEVSQSDIGYLEHVGNIAIEKFIEYIGELDMNNAERTKLLSHLANTKAKVFDSPEFKKATVSAVKGIQLNAKAEIGKLDADIEKMAQKFATEFGVKTIWARNIIGMFGINIDRKDRQKFLQACLQGKALDIDKMLKTGEGPIDSVVTTEIPKVKEVFKSVKDTLLDISLSTGQRGATGPFEALLAIMGGARKPGAGEGGDIKLPNGKQFEVKSTSLTPSTTLKKDGSLSDTGKASNAWLDSTAGGEISGAAFRQVGTEWILKQGFRSPILNEAWKNADFRKKGLENLNRVFDIINKKNKNNSVYLIHHMMSKMFPSIVNLKEFDFVRNCFEIEKAVRQQSTRDIAKIQGIMALLEYHVGKGNDGFIFFNSSTQEYKMFEGINGIMKLVNDSGNVHFTFPMTIGSSQKCSPGIYYGPDPKSETAKKYFKEFNSDPKRVQRYRQAQENKIQDLENLRGFD